MNKFISITLIAAGMLFVGCGNNGHSYVPQHEPDVKPLPPKPSPDVPGVGTGSVDYNPSCKSGFATVTYVYQSSSNIDSNSFVIVHSVDGVQQSITSAAGYSNGSISKMEEKIYVQANNTDGQLVHQISVDFVSDGVSQVNSFAFTQPSCYEPKPDPEPDPKPKPPVIDIPMYTASTGYNVGDLVRVDKGNVVSTYRCTQDYVSGAGGGWTTFKTELGNWQWVEDHLPTMSINIK